MQDLLQASSLVLPPTEDGVDCTSKDTWGLGLLAMAHMFAAAIEGHIMSAGPVGGEYPGTPVAIIMAAFCLFLVVKFSLSAFRRRRDGAASYGTHVVVAIGAVYLLVIFLWGIWIQWIHR